MTKLSNEWEQGWWSAGYRSVCGVDEVGRGALAGPLVAAAVVIGPVQSLSDELSGIADSKTLDRARREAIATQIVSLADAVGIGEVTAEEIDTIGLGAANRLAMTRAIDALRSEPDVLLVDAMTLDVGTPQVGLIDGDAKCLCIAAASIVAKVHRDRIMVGIGDSLGAYGFAQHVGYGTAAHLRALGQLGPCEVHRRSFAPVGRCRPS